jgi:hypothetical protein
MDDARATPPSLGRETTPSEGIRLVIAQGGGLVTSDRLRWPRWETAPATTEREKASVAILEQYLRSFDHTLELRVRIAARTASALTLDWLGGGILQAAPSVTGPWGRIGRGAPTVVNQPTTGDRFFRVER